MKHPRQQAAIPRVRGKAAAPVKDLDVASLVNENVIGARVPQREAAQIQMHQHICQAAQTLEQEGG